MFTSRDGLTDEIWSAVAVDGEGFVWAGSASGLARFDGYRWVMWPVIGARSLVHAIQADGDGRLWAVFEREGLARYDGHDWHLLGALRGGDKFSVVEQQGRREYWLGHDSGMARLQQGVWRDDAAYWPAAISTPALLEQTDHLFGESRDWIGSTTDGLWYRTRSPRPGPWTRFMHPDIVGIITDVLHSDDGGREELWVLANATVARIRDDGVRVWSARRGELPTAMLYAMAETRGLNGDLTHWIASRAGLVRIRGDRLDVFDRHHGLPSDAIRGLAVQRTAEGVDVLWLATEGGMARAVLADSPWQTVSLLGARDNGVLGLMLEPDGHGGERVWAGSSRDGLGLLERGQWRYFTYATGKLPAPSVRGIWRLPDASGRYRRLLGLYGTGLFEITDDLRIVPFASPWTPHPEDTAMAALSRAYHGAREWWIAARRSGVYRWRDGVWSRYALERPSEPWPVYALAEQIDAAGRSWLWAAGDRGLALFDGEAWRRVSRPSGIPQNALGSIALLRDRGRQELWLGSLRDGVIRLDVNDPRRPRLIDERLPPAPDPTVYSVQPDHQGHVYVCTNNGVQLLAPVAGGGYAEQVFRRVDGLVHDECNLGSQAIDAQNRYWVGTLGGLGMFDPDGQRRASPTQPKPLYFTGLRVDGQEQALADAAPVRLAAGAHEVRIEYTLLAGFRESETRYRSQLMGYDPAPTGWVSGRVRTFTGLPPGAFELRVEARDYQGTVSRHASFHFSIAPHWYQVRWLRGLGVLLLALGMSGVVWTYARIQRRLREEVAHRTEDLRHANARLTELSYLDSVTGLANRRRLMEALGSAVARARERQMPLGLILADIDHFKAYNDRHGHLAGDMALRAVAQTLDGATRTQDLVARFGGEEFACLMNDANVTAVMSMAERMRASVEALSPRSLGNDHQTITLSVGVLCRVPLPDEQSNDLLDLADAALYRAKRDGRNRLVLSSASVVVANEADANR